MERRRARLPFAQIHVGPVLDQNFHGFFITIATSQEQGRRPTDVAPVDAGAMLQEHGHRFYVTFLYS